MAKLGDHPGFKAVQKHIAEMEHLPMESAGAILASSSRKASPAAKAANPRLKRVRGTGGMNRGKGQATQTTDITSMFKNRDKY